MFEYYFDLDFAEQIISQYKDLIWLTISLLSTLLVIYGIILPQHNGLKQRKLETTLSLIDRWTSQGMSQTLNEYQRQVVGEHVRNIASESKTRLCSFFHTLSLLIREKKVDEALIRKSQIGVGFVCFYLALSQEQPALVEGATFYGKEFRALYRRWKGLAKLPRAQKGDLSALYQQFFPDERPLQAAAPTEMSLKRHLQVVSAVKAPTSGA